MASITTPRSSTWTRCQNWSCRYPRLQMPQRPMASEDSLAHRNHQVLKELLAEVKELRALFSDFSAEGLPLRAQTITPELLASLLTATALINRERPGLSHSDLQGRVQAAQVLADQLLNAHSQFRTETQAERLNRLAQQP